MFFIQPFGTSCASKEEMHFCLYLSAPVLGFRKGVLVADAEFLDHLGHSALALLGKAYDSLEDLHLPIGR